MTPDDVSRALDRLQEARARAGMRDPEEAGPELSDDDFAQAEARLGFVLPETLRKWFRWRKGAAATTGNYRARLLVGWLEHLTLDDAVELVEMFKEIHAQVMEEDASTDHLRNQVPLLDADSWVLLVDASTPELDVNEYYQGKVKESGYGRVGLLGTIEQWINELDAPPTED